jgi:hypothetical protein
MLTLLLPLLALAAPLGKATAESPNPYRFIEMESYKEEPTVPPALNVTFAVDCADEFVKVIREEITDEKTGMTKIMIGGIVRSNPQSPCVGSFRDKTIRAGNTYAGKQFEVVKILKEPRRNKVMKSTRR